MSYYTEKQIRAFGSSQENVRLAESALRKAITNVDAPHVFLSHSHQDKELARSAKTMLARFGMGAYIDWEDPEMLAATSTLTARSLKAKIRRSSKFVMLASVSGLRSLWVPWELGYADGVKQLSDIAIFPAANDTGEWPGNEYVGLYSCIEFGKNSNTGEEGPAVFEPEESTGVWLGDWFSGITIR